MVDFMQAVKWMKEGKQVISEINYGATIYIEDEEIQAVGNSKPTFCASHFEATDWEIYEEDNFVLADKQIEVGKIESFIGVYRLKDIKTFIKKIKEDCKGMGWDEQISKIIDKRAGDL